MSVIDRSLDVEHIQRDRGLNACQPLFGSGNTVGRKQKDGTIEAYQSAMYAYAKGSIDDRTLTALSVYRNVSLHGDHVHTVIIAYKHLLPRRTTKIPRDVNDPSVKSLSKMSIVASSAKGFYVPALARDEEIQGVHHRGHPRVVVRRLSVRRQI
jgi:hypothetical protein